MGSGSSTASAPSLPPAAIITSGLSLVEAREYQGLRNLLSLNRHSLAATDWAEVAGSLLEKASGEGCLEIMELLIGKLPSLGDEEARKVR